MWSRALFASLSNKMAADSWWQKLLVDELDHLSSEEGKAIRFDDDFKNSFPNDCGLGRDAWDNIDACTTVTRKVHTLVRTIERRGERAFKALVCALWKSGQVEPATLLDKFGALRPKTVVWLCCSEYQAHSVLQCLLGFKLAASNQVAKTVYCSDMETVYCQIQVAFTDFFEDLVRHLFYVVYPESEDVTVVQKCVRSVQQKLQPSLVVHVGTVCSSDMSLTIGDSTVPSTVNGLLLSPRVMHSTAYAEFCKRLDTSNVIQGIFKDWDLRSSYSVQLASVVLEQQQEREREGGGLSASALQRLRIGVESGHFWLAVERGGHLGTINLVTNENDEVSSLAFTPADSLVHQVERMKGDSHCRLLLEGTSPSHAHLPSPQVADRPVSSCAKAQGPVCAPETDLSLVTEMHAKFDEAPLLCVFCVSSLFPGLVDCSSEQNCTKLAAALAVELVGQCIDKNRKY